MRFSLFISLIVLFVLIITPSVSQSADWYYTYIWENSTREPVYKVRRDNGRVEQIKPTDSEFSVFTANNADSITVWDGAGNYQSFTPNSIGQFIDPSGPIYNSLGELVTPGHVPSELPFDGGPIDDPGTWPVPDVTPPTTINGVTFDPNAPMDTDISFISDEYSDAFAALGNDGLTHYFAKDKDGNWVEIDSDTGEAMKTEGGPIMCRGGDGTDPGADENCQCTKGGEKDTESGECECKEGEARNGYGQCVPDDCNPDPVFLNLDGNIYWKGIDLTARKRSAELYENKKVDKGCSCEFWTFNNQYYKEDKYWPPHCAKKKEDGTGGGGMPGGGGGGMPGGGGGGGGLPGNLGGLNDMLGGGNLLQALGPLIGMLGQAMGNQGDQGGYQNYDPDRVQNNFPVDQSCLNELRSLERQLEDSSSPTELSDQCMGQLEILLGDSDMSVIRDTFDNDDEDNGDGDGDEDNDNDDEDNGDGDGDDDNDGIEATACVETESHNADCTEKKIINKDGRITFGEGDDATTYKKRGDKDVFVDTETGEKFTWEEVAALEGVTDDERDSLFDTLFADDEDHSAVRALIQRVFDSRTVSMIDSILNSTNYAISNGFAAIGDRTAALFGRTRAETSVIEDRTDQGERRSNVFYGGE